MKHVALVLLVVGIGLTAAFGARNPADIDHRTAAKARSGVAASAANDAQSAFCEAYGAADLPDVAFCSEADAALNAATLPGDLAALHASWATAQASAEVAAAEAEALHPPASGKRFGDWFSLAGLPFLIGLLMLVAGAILSRVAAKQDATSEESHGDGPRDFGAAINALGGRIHTLADEIAHTKTADPGAVAVLLKQIQSIQLEGFEPLIDARLRVQARFGLAGYAAIFGPLSASERFLNRAWCALVDDHLPEATASLRHSAEEITTAISEVNAATKAG